MIKNFCKKTTALALLVSAMALPANAADINISVNGTPLAADVPPTVLNNRVLLPLRACAEALNSTVNYDPANGKIDVISGNNKVELQLNSRTAAINGTVSELDIEPQVLENRTLVPLRFLGEALQAQVNWNGADNSVTITAAKPSADTTSNSTNNAAQDDNTTNTDDVYLPTMDIIANQALQQINSVRLQKDLNSLISTAELKSLAEAHSQAMSEADTLANKLSGAKSLSDRAADAGIATPNELIACIDYSRENVYKAITAWFASEPTRSMLLNASAGYIGISASVAEDSTKVYLTAEIMPYRAYFIGLPLSSQTTNGKIALRGRSSQLTQEVFLYRLSDKNPQMYTDKQTYTATGDGSYFHTELELPQSGTYAIEAGGCTVRVAYRP